MTVARQNGIESRGTSENLVETWRRALPRYELALFNVLVENYPNSYDRGSLATASNKSLASSAFAAAIGTLKKNDLVKASADGALFASPTLFTKAA